MNEINRIDEDLLYVRLAVETLWIALVGNGTVDAELGVRLIDEALLRVETGAVENQILLARARDNLDKLAARVQEIAAVREASFRAQGDSRRGEGKRPGRGR